jgi:hypothetical protein
MARVPRRRAGTLQGREEVRTGEAGAGPDCSAGLYAIYMAYILTFTENLYPDSYNIVMCVTDPNERAVARPADRKPRSQGNESDYGI